MAKLKYDYAKLEKLKDDVEMECHHALQQKGFVEEELERLNSKYGYKHTKVANSIHHGILRKLYTSDEINYLSVLLKDYGKDTANFGTEDNEAIIEKFISKYPNPSKTRNT